MILFIFRIFTQNIDCRYTLEPPHRGGSNEYPQPMFKSKIKENIKFSHQKIIIFIESLHNAWTWLCNEYRRIYTCNHRFFERFVIKLHSAQRCATGVKMLLNVKSLFLVTLSYVIKCIFDQILNLLMSSLLNSSTLSRHSADFVVRLSKSSFLLCCNFSSFDLIAFIRSFVALVSGMSKSVQASTIVKQLQFLCLSVLQSHTLLYYDLCSKA